MTIKRAVALAAALTLSVGLSACGDEEETPNPTEVVTTETSAESATGDDSTDEERLDGPADGKPSELEINEALWESFVATVNTDGVDDAQLEQARTEFHVLFECVLDDAYDDLSVEGAQKLAEGTSSSPTELSEADDELMGNAADKCAAEYGWGPLGYLPQADAEVSDGR